MSKMCDKYNQYLRMEDLKLPVFLNTEEKYNELVRKLIRWKIWRSFLQIIGRWYAFSNGCSDTDEMFWTRCNFGAWNERCELRVRSDRINHPIYDFKWLKKNPKAIQNRRLRKKNLILTLKVVKDIWSVIAMASDLKHWIEQSAYLITIPKYIFQVWY